MNVGTGPPPGFTLGWERPSCQPRCRADMVRRISAGVGPLAGPPLATMVRRRGGSARNCGA
ncbi:MAG: hypothetical protein WAK82_24450, partial [Streptosporangiaceae bacterium]